MNNVKCEENKLRIEVNPKDKAMLNTELWKKLTAGDEVPKPVTWKPGMVPFSPFCGAPHGTVQDVVGDKH